VLNPKKALILEENYSQGLKNGKQKSFYPNGSKKAEENFLAGVKHGEQLSWHENGELEKKAFYDQGAPQGIWTSWYRNGNKRSEVASGKYGWEGLYRDWYSNGHLHLAAQYLNGQLEGTYTLHFSQGKKQSERRYSKGVLEGAFEEWGPKGNKLCASLYREGKFQEWVQEPNGDNIENKDQSVRELASQSLRGDFDGNGYLDQVNYLENSRRAQVLLRSQDKTIKEIILSEPMVELYSLRGREGQFGEPATPRDGLVVWGKGKETKVYLYDFDSEKFEMTTYMSDLDI
jgi:antitoxin component YwqK of YwqJK toxin-antitoxin module